MAKRRVGNVSIELYYDGFDNQYTARVGVDGASRRKRVTFDPSICQETGTDDPGVYDDAAHAACCIAMLHEPGDSANARAITDSIRKALEPLIQPNGAILFSRE